MRKVNKTRDREREEKRREKWGYVIRAIEREEKREVGLCHRILQFHTNGNNNYKYALCKAGICVDKWI